MVARAAARFTRTQSARVVVSYRCRMPRSKFVLLGVMVFRMAQSKFRCSCGNSIADICVVWKARRFFSGTLTGGWWLAHKKELEC